MVTVLSFKYHHTGLVSDREEENDPCPLIKTDECTFAYIKQSNVYMVATMRANSNVAMLFSLMHRICQVNPRITSLRTDTYSRSWGNTSKRWKRRVSETTS